MTHARTLARYVGIAGLVAGLLAPVPSLAAVRSNGIEILSTSATGVKTGQYIEAAASVAYQHKPGNERIYTRQVVPVARSTLRRGALAALSRGVMHPGLQLAVAAAGFVLSNDNEIMTPDFVLPDEFQDEKYQAPDGYCYTSFRISACYSSSAEACQHLANYWTANSSQHHELTRVSGQTCDYWRTPMQAEGSARLETASISSSPDYRDGPTLEPATDQDLQTLDQHLPESIVEDLWFDEESPYPWEWQDTNDSIDPGLNDITDAKGSSPPEVRHKAKKWAENIAASLEGEEKPNPDTDTDGGVAGDAMYEAWQEPIPPFGEVEPEWQVETIDSLPDYDIGLGSGSCPAPTAITLPAPFNSVIELDWQPVCDFASMIRGAVIAVCMILSLYIVLRSA